MKTLNGLLKVLKINKSQKIDLVQVTGKASISGYVDLELYFHTKEAYVINGMTTLLILGNSFANQYSLTLCNSRQVRLIRSEY